MLLHNLFHLILPPTSSVHISLTVLCLLVALHMYIPQSFCITGFNVILEMFGDKTDECGPLIITSGYGRPDAEQLNI